jgi:hypothetical protein
MRLFQKGSFLTPTADISSHVTEAEMLRNMILKRKFAATIITSGSSLASALWAAAALLELPFNTAGTIEGALSLALGGFAIHAGRSRARMTRHLLVLQSR